MIKDTIESVVCVPLYNDLCSVYFGMYENEDRFNQYRVFVIHSIQRDSYVDLTIFSSSNDLLFDGKHTETAQWIEENNVMEQVNDTRLQYKPFISKCTLQKNHKKKDLEVYLKKELDEKIGNKDENHKMSLETEAPLSHKKKECRSFVFIYKSKISPCVPPIITTITEAVIEPWRKFLSSDLKNNDPPYMNFNAIVERNLKKPEISELFHTVTKISSLYYESSKCNGCITVTSKKDIHESFTFIKALEFTDENAKLFRKILQTTKHGLSILVKDKMAYGVGKPLSKKYTFEITGHLEWQVSENTDDSNSNQLLRFKHGNYFIPLAIEMNEWYIKNRTIPMGEKGRKMIFPLIKKIQEGGHGALLIISSDAQGEVKRLCDKNRGIMIQPVDSNAPGFVTAMTLIDGALIFGEDGDCYGIGMIVDGDASAVGKPDRGSRYNSAKNYITRRYEKEKKESYAIILSEDGYIDIISGHNCAVEAGIGVE